MRSKKTLVCNECGEKGEHPRNRFKCVKPDCEGSLVEPELVEMSSDDREPQTEKMEKLRGKVKNSNGKRVEIGPKNGGLMVRCLSCDDERVIFDLSGIKTPSINCKCNDDDQEEKTNLSDDFPHINDDTDLSIDVPHGLDPEDIKHALKRVRENWNDDDDGFDGYPDIPECGAFTVPINLDISGFQEAIEEAQKKLEERERVSRGTFKKSSVPLDEVTVFESGEDIQKGDIVEYESASDVVDLDIADCPNEDCDPGFQKITNHGGIGPKNWVQVVCSQCGTHGPDVRIESQKQPKREAVIRWNNCFGGGDE